MHAYIFNIQRFSLHDGPGIRTTVFFQGCPLQCVWCHNPEGIPSHLESKHLNNGYSSIKKYTLDELMDEILKDKAFFDESDGGVTFSGGEPLMQCEFLIEILKQLREAGIHTAVDTSGYAPMEVFSEVLKFTDLVLFDLKIMDNKKHELYTGTENSMVHKNLDLISSSNVPYRIRIPLVNEITADDKNLDEMAALLKANGGNDIDLLSYHDLGKGKKNKMGIKSKHNLSAPDEGRIAEIKKKFEAFGFTVNLGG